MRAILQELVYDAPVGGAVWPFDRHYIRPPHFHGQVEFLLVRSGTATVHLGTRAERLRAGQLCWILPCLPHVMSDFSADFDMWVVELEAPIVAASWEVVTGHADDDRRAPRAQVFGWVAAMGERLAGRPVVDVGKEEARRLGEFAAGVWSAPSTKGVRDTLRALCELALRATLASVKQRHGATLTDLASSMLLASPLMDRRDLAADLGVSEGFVSRSFGRELGVSFVEHRARSRLAHFLALVPDDSRNFLDAALAAGFGSYSQFHRVFTRVAGASPSDYFTTGRHRRQLLISSDREQPHTAPMHMLSHRQRHRARLDRG